MKLSKWQVARASEPEVSARIADEKRRAREFRLALKARRDAALSRYREIAAASRREIELRRKGAA
jgi:hypothetical protein